MLFIIYLFWRRKQNESSDKRQSLSTRQTCAWRNLKIKIHSKFVDTTPPTTSTTTSTSTTKKSTSTTTNKPSTYWFIVIFTNRTSFIKQHKHSNSTNTINHHLITKTSSTTFTITHEEFKALLGNDRCSKDDRYPRSERKHVPRYRKKAEHQPFGIFGFLRLNKQRIVLLVGFCNLNLCMEFSAIETSTSAAFHRI